MAQSDGINYQNVDYRLDSYQAQISHSKSKNLKHFAPIFLCTAQLAYLVMNHALIFLRIQNYLYL